MYGTVTMRMAVNLVMSASPSSLLRASLYSRPAHSSALLVPDRWAPSGWKYISPDHKSDYFRHRYRRKASKQPASKTASFRTTHQSAYIQPQYIHSIRPVLSQSDFPPLPSDSHFIKKVLQGHKGRSESQPRAEMKDWASEWVRKKSFGKRRHRDTEWQKLFQSQGTVR